MTKTFKKIAASIMAMTTLAVGAASMNVSAISWGLYYASGAPGSATKLSDPAGFYISSSKSSVSEQCTSFSSTQQSNGSTAYVYYNVYAVKSDGTKLSGLSGAKYHYQKDNSAKTISLSQTVPAYSTIYGNYSLKNYSTLSASDYGTIS